MHLDGYVSTHCIRFVIAARCLPSRHGLMISSWRTCLAGIGASHQTGWTGLVAWFMMSRCVLDPKEILDKGFEAVAMKIVRSY